MIYVLGARGNLGRALAELLAPTGLPFRQLGHDKPSAESSARAKSPTLDFLDQGDVLVLAAPLAEHIPELIMTAARRGASYIDHWYSPRVDSRVQSIRPLAADAAFVATGCGIRPGLAAVAARYACRMLSTVRRLRVGIFLAYDWHSLNLSDATLSELTEPLIRVGYARGAWRRMSEFIFDFGGEVGRVRLSPYWLPELNSVIGEQQSVRTVALGGADVHSSRKCALVAALASGRDHSGSPSRAYCCISSEDPYVLSAAPAVAILQDAASGMPVARWGYGAAALPVERMLTRLSVMGVRHTATLERE